MENNSFNIDWFNLIWEIFPYVFVAGLALWIYHKISLYVKSYRQKQRVKKGKEAEKDARLLLQSRGFIIEDYQPKFKYRYHAAGENISVSLTPDFIVSKNGRRFVVEVKSGKVNSQLSYKETRRQILEYSLATGLQAIYIDMVEHKIYELEFPFGVKKSINWWKWGTLIALAILTSLGLYFIIQGFRA